MGGHKGFSSCGNTSLVTVSYDTGDPYKALGPMTWVLKTVTKGSQGRLRVSQGVRMGLPESLISKAIIYPGGLLLRGAA